MRKAPTRGTFRRLATTAHFRKPSDPIMLSRDALRSGAYLDSFRDLPTESLWSAARIEASLAATLAQRPDDSPVWVFAYGSLMWNPLIHFDARAAATLRDWHRSFCIRLVAGRGSPDSPGRMLALEPGGSAAGVALRLAPESMDEELRLIWIREMVAGSYLPTWAPITFEDGTRAHAIVFVADRAQPQYESDASVRTVVPLIAAARGHVGSNQDYVLDLEAALAEAGLTDGYIEQLATEIRAFSQRSPGSPGSPHATSAASCAAE
ncbi:gamma-glutamylcyclotransferase [Paraburkholderia humisilvae]|uniref:glutathione-specific gamma-glutamylcyclotransferase n=1 Tax=Paraburkholderia humisilvae TaxID=627669 RepID=A0A6J5DU93_9BURK|nr:gamma-glutamylcyclotransferase [Paraburkholderia humisilvae]CAB3757799.1 Glutathione-specific gamma-glutamylcyclotransferase [Paraburkholderia humisilvae]